MRATRIVMLFGFVIGLYALFAGNANAQCVMSLNGDRPAFPNRSAFQELRAQMLTELRAPKQDPDGLAVGEAATIVGLWDLKFIVNNEVVDEGFDQFHADGTEILND